MQLSTMVERALCLKAVVAIALGWPDSKQLEKLPREELEKANQDTDRFWDMVRNSGVYENLTPTERAFAEQRWPGLSDRDVVAFSWRIEAYKTLLWALHLVDDVGPYHELADPSLVRLKAAEIRSGARLRADEEVSRAREIAELWHWRSRTRELFPDDDALVAGTAKAAFERGDLTELVEGDFGVKGASYAELSEQDWQTVSSITRERHYALNWICGEESWDEVRTDT